jgi:RND family efflux transporter MFP subunit
MTICGILRIFIVSLLLFPSCSRKPQEKPPPPPLKVGVAEIEKGDLELSLRVSGTLQYTANTTVSAEVSAQVKSIEVSDGQLVDQGQVLLIFDDSKIREIAKQAESNLHKDQATLAYSKTEWEKNLGLLKSESVSQTQFDQKLSVFQHALAQVEADKAALAKATEDLKRTQVHAPVRGRLSKRYMEKGDWVFEGGKLFQISDYTRIYLETYLADMDVAKLNIEKVLSGGEDADVAVDPYPEEIFRGRLTYIDAVANDGRLFQIRIYMDNPDMRLLQGMFGRARIVVNRVPDAILIPLSALLDQLRNNDYNSVFLVDKDTKAQLTKIRIGANNRRYARVLEGLKEGDRVVVRGKEILSSGQPLETTLMPRPEIKIKNEPR